MKTPRSARIQDLVGLLHALYPPALAEAWDNVGLQTGDPSHPLERVFVGLDPSEMALAAAHEAQAQALLTHHPLIFQPLRHLTPATATGRILRQAIRSDIAILCAHTNLDRAPAGLNDWLGELLGIADAQPLATGEAEGLLKIVVFVPGGYEDQVAKALFAGGAGHIGRYSDCSFATEGTGTFQPADGTQPFIGQAGSRTRTREIRLETVVPRDQSAKAVARMLKAHPYEEVAYDLIPLANRRPDIGLGRIGRLPQATSLESFAARVKTALHTDFLRLVGDPQASVQKVAWCGGSGASLLSEAARQGADLLVTGDIKYHEARQAEELGIALIDAGHFATEQLMVQRLAAVLRQEAGQRGLALTFIPMTTERDPFRLA
jgi:dinuclear metal center YbgI/SA1388 family protein